MGRKTLTQSINQSVLVCLSHVGGCCVAEVADAMLAGYGLETLEYVHVSVSLSHERRGDVELILVCPSGTTSIIGATRSLDKYVTCY